MSDTSADAPTQEISPETAAKIMADETKVARRVAAQRVRDQRQKLANAKRNYERARLAFDGVVANEASTKPLRPDWYEHPATLTRKGLLEAAGLTTVSLHRLMERHQKRAPKARRRNGRPA